MAIGCNECVRATSQFSKHETVSAKTSGGNNMPSTFKADFLGIGTPKCGSTWLFFALGQHPKICLSEPKEINYFNQVDFATPYVHGKDKLPFINPNFAKDLAWYVRHYKHCPADALKGEFSPSYILDEEAPSRIHRTFPKAKLLASLRDPVDQIHSAYWARSRYSGNDIYETFEKAIKLDPRYLARGYYAKYLKRYLRYFDKEQIKVVLFEDIVDRPEETIRDIFDFLSVDSNVELDLNRIPKNQAKKSRFFSPVPMMEKFSNFLIERNQAALLHHIRKLGLKKILLRLSAVDHPREPVNPQIRNNLRRLFHEDTCELETLLNRDLSAWK